jgi:hypothetical protein
MGKTSPQIVQPGASQRVGWLCPEPGVPLPRLPKEEIDKSPARGVRHPRTAFGGALFKLADRHAEKFGLYIFVATPPRQNFAQAIGVALMPGSDMWIISVIL